MAVNLVLGLNVFRRLLAHIQKKVDAGHVAVAGGATRAMHDAQITV